MTIDEAYNETVRKLIDQARQPDETVLTPTGLHRLIEAAQGGSSPLTARQLTRFLGLETNKIGPKRLSKPAGETEAEVKAIEPGNFGSEKLRPLHAFATLTRLGRALRYPNAESIEQHDDAAEVALEALIEQFLRAQHDGEERKLDLAGTYFMYHGSYLKPDSVAIHLIEVTAAGPLTVRDSIRDTANGRPDRLLSAVGCMSLIEGVPQLVLYSKKTEENRSGFSVFVAEEHLETMTGSLTRVTGLLTGVTGGGETFTRFAALKRILGKTSRQRLTDQTGTYPFGAIPNWEDDNPLHAEQFKLLASGYDSYLDTQDGLHDPIASYSARKEGAAKV